MKKQYILAAINKGIEMLENLRLAFEEKADEAAEAPLVSEADKLKGAKAEKAKRARKAAPAKVEAPAEEEELEDEAEETDDAEEADDLEDLDEEDEESAPKVDASTLRTLLVAYAKKHSKEKAYKVLARFGKAKKVTDVKPEDYQKLHDLLSK